MPGNPALLLKLAGLAIAIAALATGLLATWNWYQASRIRIFPIWQRVGGIEQLGGDPVALSFGIMQAVQEASSYSQKGAFWTAVSVTLCGLSALVSSLA
jgi:hypothetical protein